MIMNNLQKRKRKVTNNDLKIFWTLLKKAKYRQADLSCGGFLMWRSLICSATDRPKSPASKIYDGKVLTFLFFFFFEGLYEEKKENLIMWQFERYTDLLFISCFFSLAWSKRKTFYFILSFFYLPGKRCGKQLYSSFKAPGLYSSCLPPQVVGGNESVLARLWSHGGRQVFLLACA